MRADVPVLTTIFTPLDALLTLFLCFLLALALCILFCTIRLVGCTEGFIELLSGYAPSLTGGERA